METVALPSTLVHRQLCYLLTMYPLPERGRRMPKQRPSSRLRSPQRGVEFLAAMLAEEDPGRLKRWPELAEHLPSEDEARTLIRLTLPAVALVDPLADEARRTLVPITRPRRSDGIEYALRRLEAERPPELERGSLFGLPGGESPVLVDRKASVPRWVKRRLEELRPSATAAWGRSPRDSFGGAGPKKKASDSMVIQYVIERLRRGSSEG